MAQAREVLRFYRDFARGCPDEMLAAAALMTSHEGAPVAVIIASYIGAIETGEALMAPLRSFGSPLVDTIAPTSYVELNSLFDAAVPYGNVQRYWKSSFLKEIPDDLIEIFVERSAKFLSPMSMVLFFHMHGAVTRIDRDFDGIRIARRPMGLRCDLAMDRSGGGGRPHKMDPRVLDGSRAFRHRRSVCQSSRR